jgi:ribose transport system ATP-binding protein
MENVLEIQGVEKSFPGVKALDDVSIAIRPHEVVGLIGENGAGKSTLIKVLSGVYQLDRGRILVNGKEVRLRGPRDAFDHGIAMVFQEQSILPTLSIAENIFLGREQEFLAGGFLNKRKMHEAARTELAKVHLDLSPGTLCSELTFAERQMVEIAKAMSLDSRIDGHIVILLDEPTSMLEQREVDLLFQLVRDLKRRASFVFISHRLDEVIRISDRVYVMRDGAVVGEMPARDATLPKLHQLMVGRSLHVEYYRQARQSEPAEDVVLEVDRLSRDGSFRDVSFSLRRGEILGVAGVIGSGREELARTLAGLLTPDSGTVRLHGRPVVLDRPAKAVKNGVGYIPSERKVEGIVGADSVAGNMTIASLSRFTAGGLIRHAAERRVAGEWVRRLNIKTPSVATPVGSLSGGNQQKVVLARWRIAGSEVVILDHPTRGIDVGAKEDVYELIRDMTAEGLSIVLLADTLEEVIGLSNRILVMKDGEVTATFDAPPGAKPDQVALISRMV